MNLEVTVQINGEDAPVGTLHANVRRGIETASFRYYESYLLDPRAFPLAPDMPLSTGALHTQNEAMFRVFQDCMPDRWGRNLMLRAERRQALSEKRTARALFEKDFLSGVNDRTRQGAIRIWADGAPLASPDEGVPHEVRIPDLLNASDRAASDLDADLGDLFAAGSSLGGARPKASVIGAPGELLIAKFPKADEDPLEDVCAWEKTALDLATLSGIRVPGTRLLRIGGRSVLLLERFDREKETRIPYISGLTAVQGTDGERYSYLDLVSFLEEEGAAPSKDIPELWTRILFSCAIGNTDDHMRNHGFLRERAGWRLSPAFDINPTPGNQPKHLRSLIDLDGGEAAPQVAFEACEWYRLDKTEARAIAHRMAGALSRWRKIANANGISKAAQERMSSCLDAGAERLRKL